MTTQNLTKDQKDYLMKDDNFDSSPHVCLGCGEMFYSSPKNAYFSSNGILNNCNCCNDQDLENWFDQENK